MRIPFATPRFAAPRRAASAALLAASLFVTACSDDDDGDGPGAPPPPASVAPSASTTSVTITWAASANAATYIIERADGATGGTFAQVGQPVAATTFTDTGLGIGRTYRYRVVAVSSGGERSAPSAEVAATTQERGTATVTLTGNITANRTLYADTTYVLSGYVKVRGAGTTLTIQPGTTIVGDTTVAGSSLWITRGARISADGRADAPIVFTSQRAAPNRKPGDWGGIIVVGNGIINRTGATINTEGPAGQAENYAGGSDNNDNSGVLRYVRIEFAGFDVSNGAGQELNSLSMYAVGRGTTLEYVQTLAGLDDSFEWWGGAVDGRYLVSYETGDDHFDWTEGYQGRNQFLIALQSTRLPAQQGSGSFGTDPRGFEGDGCDPAATGCTVTATSTSAPYSMPVFANFTLVGPGTAVAGFPGDGNGAVIRRGSGGTFRNGVIARWPGTGLNIRDAFTDVLRQQDSLSVRGVVLAENGSNFDPAASAFFGKEANFAQNNVRTAPAAAALFTSLTAASLDWRPTTGSVLATGGEQAPAARVANAFAGRPTPGWQNTTYVGAIDPTATPATAWYAGWTRYATN